MDLVFGLLHLSESLRKYDICCTACINQNIMDQKSFDHTRDNHSIVVWVVLELNHEAFPDCEIHQIEMAEVAEEGGALHCISWNIRR